VKDAPSAPLAWLRHRRADLAIAVGLLALAAVAVGPGLLPSRTPLPLDVLGLFEPWRLEWPTAANPVVGDAVLQFSSRVYMADTLKHGHFPLWNPTIMAGHPHAGDTNTSPFYPLLLLLSWLFHPLTAYALQLLLQMWLGGLFLYAWMRQLALGRLPSAVAAVAWMLSGFQQVWLDFPSFTGTLCWLPAIPAAWEFARRTGNRGGVALGGLALGMAVTAGQVQFALYGLLLLVAYGFLRLLAGPRDEWRRGLLTGAGILGLGLALAAVHLLPVYELARDTIRAPFSLSALVATGVPLPQLVTALAPWFLGDPRRGDYRGAQNASEMMLYIGLLPLLLALVAWYVRRDRLAATFSLLSLLVAAIALASPLAWPLAFTPWLQRFGLMRWLALWPLVAAPLTALALDAAARDAIAALRLRRAVVTVASLLAALLLLETWRDPRGAGTVPAALSMLVLSAAVLVLWARRPASRWRGLAVAGVVAADLLALGQGYTPSAPVTAYYPPVAPLDRLVAERRHAPFRVAELQGDAIALGPSVAPSLGLDEVGGYTSSVRESYLQFLAALSSPTDNGALLLNPNMVSFGDANPLLLRLLNVRYVLAVGELPPFDRPLDPAIACTHTRTLAPGESVGATVVPWADGLNRIDVAVASGGPVALHLRDAPDSPDHRAYAELPPGDGPLRSLYFEPIADSANRPFHVSVDLPDGATGPAPQVCLDRDNLAVGLGATEAPYPRAFGANGLNVYRAPDSLGRAWVVPVADVADDQAAVLSRLARGEIDPAHTVLLELAQMATADAPFTSSPVPDRPSASDNTSPTTHLSLRDDGPNVRRLTLPEPATGWLVVSEAWAPGWHAEVDGRPQPVLRADGGIMAVPLGTEASDVVLYYRPMVVTLGAIISLAALLIALVLVWRGITGGRRAP
jgi:hypothetical protein